MFLETFDSIQMRYAGSEWKKAVDHLGQLARNAGSVCRHAPLLQFGNNTDCYCSQA